MKLRKQNLSSSLQNSKHIFCFASNLQFSMHFFRNTLHMVLCKRHESENVCHFKTLPFKMPRPICQCTCHLAKHLSQKWQNYSIITVLYYVHLTNTCSQYNYSFSDCLRKYHCLFLCAGHCSLQKGLVIHSTKHTYTQVSKWVKYEEN